MCTKVVTLSLEDVGRDDLAPVAVQEGKSRREGRSGDTPENGLGNDTPPTGLSFVNGCGSSMRKWFTHKRWTHTLDKEFVKEERLEIVGLGVGGGDIVEEDRLSEWLIKHPQQQEGELSP